MIHLSQTAKEVKWFQHLLQQSRSRGKQKEIFKECDNSEQVQPWREIQQAGLYVSFVMWK